PGVGVKNFALTGLACRHGAVPVQLIVDNDTVKAPALHVPVARVPLPPVSELQARIISVPFDRLAREAPYEERIVLEERLFAHFPDQLAKDWGFEPILTAFWATVLEQAQRTNLLGERFVSARRQWERRWGCRNLEVPVSRVAQTEVFAWFACHLLTDLPRFHAIHNESVRTYRRAHRIRSTNHPVPDLAQDA